MFNLYEKCVGPYMGISRDATRTYNGDKYRLVIYGAFNAMGLIGPEHNGIAVFNESNMTVTADKIGLINSGYFGPSETQLKQFIELLTCNDEKFRTAINSCGRNRYDI